MKRDNYELKSLNFVGSFLSAYYTDVIGFECSEEDDYGIADITLFVSDGSVRLTEVKTYNGNLLENGKYNGRWNSTTSGTIKERLYYFNEESGKTIEEIKEIDDNGRVAIQEWDLLKGIPDCASGKCAFMVNASSMDMDVSKSKYWKIMTNHATFIILARDGMVMFTPEVMEVATIGAFWIYCQHTYSKGDDRTGWERKMLIDLQKGRLFKMDAIPDSIFPKKNNKTKKR